MLLDQIGYGLAALSAGELARLTAIIRDLRRATGDFEDDAIGASPAEFEGGRRRR